MILSNQRITKVLIRLRECAGWSAPLLFRKPPKTGFLGSRPLFSTSHECRLYQNKLCLCLFYRKLKQKILVMSGVFNLKISSLNYKLMIDNKIYTMTKAVSFFVLLLNVLVNNFSVMLGFFSSLPGLNQY